LPPPRCPAGSRARLRRSGGQPAMVLAERRAFRLLFQTVAGPPRRRKAPAAYSDDESDDELRKIRAEMEKPLPAAPSGMAQGALWLANLLEEKENRLSDVPAWPILRYALAGYERDDFDSGPKTYGEAVGTFDSSSALARALAFRSVFCIMLQTGFAVVKHAPQHMPQSQILWLSADGARVWWRARGSNSLPAQFPVADIQEVEFPIS